MSWNEGINRLFASLSTLQELQLISLSRLLGFKNLLSPASLYSRVKRWHSKDQPTDEGRELIFGLLEGLSLTSLISYSPSNQGNEKEYESEEGEKGKRKSMDSFGRLPFWYTLKTKHNKENGSEKDYRQEDVN